jgi:hypothetical protein
VHHDSSLGSLGYGPDRLGESLPESLQELEVYLAPGNDLIWSGILERVELWPMVGIELGQHRNVHDLDG